MNGTIFHGHYHSTVVSKMPYGFLTRNILDWCSCYPVIQSIWYNFHKSNILNDNPRYKTVAEKL